MANTARLVVLMGANKPFECQHLSQSLKNVLDSLQQAATLLCLSHPDDLLSLPNDAQHLLWNPNGTADLDHWRTQLHILNRSYHVVHGTGYEALKQCLYALLPPSLAQDWARQPIPTRWHGVCETCGDADCEQRLFSGLLQG